MLNDWQCLILGLLVRLRQKDAGDFQVNLALIEAGAEILGLLRRLFFVCQFGITPTAEPEKVTSKEVYVCFPPGNSIRE